jgi:hypothetical protein
MVDSAQMAGDPDDDDLDDIDSDNEEDAAERMRVCSSAAPLTSMLRERLHPATALFGCADYVRSL